MTTWVQTISGKAFDLPVPTPDQIEIEDIAHALGNVCRFQGHTRRHYSVAEHSVNVCLLLKKTNLDAARYGLLHDASEAYIADVSAPLKGLPELSGYLAIEKRIQAMIYRRFGLDPDAVPPDVREADLRMLATEKAALLREEPRSWGDLPAVDDDAFRRLVNQAEYDECPQEDFLDLFHALFNVFLGLRGLEP